MAYHFRQSQVSTSSEQQAAKPGEVLCDFCIDPKNKAVKSCLVCLASYCETHLQPHLSMDILKRHQLIGPQEDLESRATVGTPERTDAQIQAMIAFRQQKIQQLCQSMELNNRDANRETAYSVQAFTALKESVEKDMDCLIQAITSRKKTTDDQTKSLIDELEQEISELQRWGNVGNTTIIKDWTNLSVRIPAYEGTAVRAMAQLEKNLTQQMNKIFLSELQRVQKHRVYVMLDPDKVHPPKAKDTEKTECKCVLASQNLSSGKFYFEVDVSGRSKWTLGLAKEIHFNRQVALSPRNAYWAICLRNKNECYAAAEPSVRLSLKSKPEKVGVFVDGEEGLVCFYDAKTATPIFTFTGSSFNKKIHPFFSPCETDGVQLHTAPESACVMQ